MSELEDVSEKLDTALLAFFDLLGQLYQEQAKMEQYLRDGYLNLSRARYSMGMKSVSTLQVPDSDMTAVLTVDVTCDEANVKYDIHKCNVKNAKKLASDDVRKRSVKEGGDAVPVVEEDVGDAPPAPVDPIKWFGVLVPQALRRSQTSFQEAASLAANVANLKHSLQNLRSEYKTLLLEKKKLSSCE